MKLFYFGMYFVNSLFYVRIRFVEIEYLVNFNIIYILFINYVCL